VDLIFTYIKRTREVFAELVDRLDIEAINTVPSGFRNNIGWNFGHIVVSTQGLCYRRTGVQPNREIPFLDGYTKGTIPEKWINREEIDILKTQATASIDQLIQDYRNGLFANISPFATSTYSLTMNTIEEVLTASLAHDNLHFGYAQGIRKALEGNKLKS